MDRRAITHTANAEPTAGVDGSGADRRAEGERRGGLRGRTLLGGRVLHGPELRFSLDLRLRDFSDHGARAILPPGQACPPAGILLVASRGRAYRMRTVWMQGSQAGLSFEVAWDLENLDLPAEARGVRRLWLELAPR